MKAVISHHDGLNTLSSILVLWFQSYFVQFDGIPVIHYWLILFHVGHQDLPKCSLRILTLWNEKRNFIVSRFQTQQKKEFLILWWLWDYILGWFPYASVRIWKDVYNLKKTWFLHRNKWVWALTYQQDFSFIRQSTCFLTKLLYVFFMSLRLHVHVSLFPSITNNKNMHLPDTVKCVW